MPFYHSRLPVDPWMLGHASTNMYQFYQFTVWIGTTSYWDKKVYPSLLAVLDAVECAGPQALYQQQSVFPPISFAVAQ